MWRYITIAAIGGVAAGVIAGVFLEKILRKMKESRILKCSEMLEKEFGEPMFANKFTLSEAKDWFTSRQDKIQDGYKGILMKINKDTFAKIESTIEIDKDVDNYILLGIYREKAFLDTLLVKYVSLDDNIKDALKEGIMVIE